MKGCGKGGGGLKMPLGREVKQQLGKGTLHEKDRGPPEEISNFKEPMTTSHNRLKLRGGECRECKGNRFSAKKGKDTDPLKITRAGGIRGVSHWPS